MAIDRVFIPTINNTYQLQQQLNAGLENIYDAIDKSALGGTVTKVATTGALTGGPITTTGTLDVADSGVTAASYTAADITVDKYGRVTKAASHSLTTGTVTNVATGTGLTGGPITATGTISVDQASVLHWTKAQTFDQLVTTATKFGSLPATPATGQRAFVTDATATTFASVAAGGGANAVPVVYDGTNWIIG